MLKQRESHGDSSGKEVTEALLFLANHCKDLGQVRFAALQRSAATRAHHIGCASTSVSPNTATRGPMRPTRDRRHLSTQVALAQSHCSRLLDLGGPDREEAKALLRDLRSQQQHGGAL